MDEKDANRLNEATEELVEAAQESYKAAVDRAFAAQEGNMRLARGFFEDWVDALEDQAELNRRTMQSLTELAREQQEVFRELSRESLNAYDGFLDSLFSYYKEVLEEPTDRR
jgi:chromosome condensin MukBEF ATPase and DNA-binding subunit MukB